MWVVDRQGRGPLLTAVAGWAIILAGCASGGTSSGGGDLTEVEFAPELGIVLDQMTRTPEGLYYADLEVGTGMEAQPGLRVTLHYNGWLPDGTLFESSLEANDPVVFVLGEEQVIRGWELGVPGMKVGGQRVMVVPPDLAYGSRGVRGVVPRRATLVFSLRLMSVGEDIADPGDST